MKVTSTGTSLSGILSLSGPTRLQGHPIAGSRTYEKVDFGIADTSQGTSSKVSLTGVLHLGYKTIRRTYPANHISGGSELDWDRGTSELRKL